LKVGDKVEVVDGRLRGGGKWPDRNGQVGIIYDADFEHTKLVGYKYIVSFAEEQKGSNLAAFDESEIRPLNPQMDFAFTE
jgi:hypothetical protein